VFYCTSERKYNLQLWEFWCVCFPFVPHIVGNGGQLASVHSDAENTFIYQLAKTHLNLTEYEAVWLGGTDTNRTDWSWSDGTQWNYTHWAPTQPDDYNGIEHCQLIYTNAISQICKRIYSSWKIQLKHMPKTQTHYHFQHAKHRSIENAPIFRYPVAYEWMTHSLHMYITDPRGQQVSGMWNDYACDNEPLWPQWNVTSYVCKTHAKSTATIFASPILLSGMLIMIIIQISDFSIY
jgi:hypothetical protein